MMTLVHCAAVAIGSVLIFYFGMRTGRHMERLRMKLPAAPAEPLKAVCEGCTHHYSYHGPGCAQYPCHCRQYIGPEPLLTIADPAIPNDLPGAGEGGREQPDRPSCFKN